MRKFSEVDVDWSYSLIFLIHSLHKQNTLILIGDYYSFIVTIAFSEKDNILFWMR